MSNKPSPEVAQAYRRIQKAYQQEKHRQELLEVELSRARIVVVDQHGRIINQAIISEH